MATLPQSPTLNVLLVTARPREEDDLNYRTTSRPLMQALENSRLPVNLVLLRPGTYEALERQYRFPEPTYGFVGRDLEILKIEKSLLRHSVLLVQGMGGTGKTTLLNYLRQLTA